MDGLDDYGSDESSLSDTKEFLPKNNPTLLLTSYSDNGNHSDDNIVHEKHEEETKKGSLVESSPLSLDAPLSKKQRVKEFILPSAPTGSCLSMIVWDKDYLSIHDNQQERKANSTCFSLDITISPLLAGKLQRLANSSKVNWADHLKSQQEFHNPHFFESVVEHFGIQHPLGSLVFNPEIQDEEQRVLGLLPSSLLTTASPAASSEDA